MKITGEHYQQWDFHWDVFLRLREGCQGLSNKTDLEIRVNPNQSFTDLLDTCVHEVLHALDWSLEHPFIEQASEEITKVVIHALHKKNLLPPDTPV